MKLIIDISEEKFKWIKEHQGVTDFQTSKKLYEAVANGIYLEDKLNFIKAELRYNGLYNERVEDLIDKHIKENKQ